MPLLTVSTWPPGDTTYPRLCVPVMGHLSSQTDLLLPLRPALPPSPKPRLTRRGPVSAATHHRSFPYYLKFLVNALHLPAPHAPVRVTYNPF